MGKFIVSYQREESISIHRLNYRHFLRTLSTNRKLELRTTPSKVNKLLETLSVLLQKMTLETGASLIGNYRSICSKIYNLPTLVYYIPIVCHYLKDPVPETKTERMSLAENHTFEQS